MIIKLSGVSATDSVLESSRETGLYLVHGDVVGKIVTVLRDTGYSTVFVRSKLVSDNQKTGRAKVITSTDGTSITCSEVVIDVKTSYISGKVQSLCLDSPFADVINRNNVSIVVH